MVAVPLLFAETDLAKAVILRKAGQFPKAERLLKKYVSPAGFDGLKSAEKIEFLRGLLELAHIRALKDDVPGSLALLNWAEGRKDPYQRAISCVKYAEILLDLGEFERASAYLKSADEIISARNTKEETGAAIGQGGMAADTGAVWRELGDEASVLKTGIEAGKLKKKFGASYCFNLRSKMLFTVEKSGFNAYNLGMGKIHKSEYRTGDNIIAYSGTDTGIAIAVLGNHHAYRFNDEKEDFYILSKIVIPYNEMIQRITFSPDANYAAISSYKQKKSTLTVYRKNFSTPHIIIDVNEPISEMMFSLDNKTLIVWHQELQNKRYIIQAYSVGSGKQIIKTYIKVNMGFSGLWPLNVFCKNIQEGIYIMSIGYKFQYGKIDFMGEIDKISEEQFFSLNGGFFSTNHAVYQIINKQKTVICKFDDYIKDDIIKSHLSPSRRFVALAAMRGYHVIDLTQKKLIPISFNLFNDYFYWGGVARNK